MANVDTLIEFGDAPSDVVQDVLPPGGHRTNCELLVDLDDRSDDEDGAEDEEEEDEVGSQVE